MIRFLIPILCLAVLAPLASAQVGIQPPKYDANGNPFGSMAGPDAPGAILRCLPGPWNPSSDTGYDGSNGLMVSAYDSLPQIYEFSEATGGTVGTIPIDSATDFGLTYDASRGLYVTCNPSTDVMKTFNGVSSSPINTWQLTSGPVGVAHDTTRDLYWYCDWSANAVVAVNPTTGALGTSYSTAAIGCTRPAGLAYIACDDYLVVGGRDQNRMFVMDASSGALITSYAAADGGNNPQGLSHNGLENLWQSSWNSNSLCEIEHNNAPCGGCTLTVSPGTCGVDRQTFTISPLTGGSWLVYWSRGLTPTVVNPPCGTVTLDIGPLGPPKYSGPPVQVNGPSITKKVPPAVCRAPRIWVQGIDLGNCCKTNPAQP